MSKGAVPAEGLDELVAMAVAWVVAMAVAAMVAVTEGLEEEMVEAVTVVGKEARAAREEGVRDDAIRSIC